MYVNNDHSANGRPPVCSARKPPLPPTIQNQRSNYGFGGVATQNISSSSAAAGGSAAAAQVTGVSGTRRRATTDLGNPAAIEMAKARAAMLSAGQEHHHHHQNQHQQQQQQQHHHHQQQNNQYQNRPIGLLETDLDDPIDADEAKKARSLLNLNGHHHHHHQQHHQQTSVNNEDDVDFNNVGRVIGNGNNPARYLQSVKVSRCPIEQQLAIAAAAAASAAAAGTAPGTRPHKSMEFLLDKDNLHFVKVRDFFLSFDYYFVSESVEFFFFFFGKGN